MDKFVRYTTHVPLALALAAVWLALPARADEVLPRADQRFAPRDVREEPSFKRHVVPLLGRLGCNGRACHGSFQGRGGFRLSLFGYDFAADHEALAEGDSPRVDLAHPTDSLILNKPTSDDEDEHGGGKRYDKNSWQYRLLLNWIAAGAENDSDRAGRLTRLEVVPPEITFHANDQTTQLRVIAHWSDGGQEDVTPLCRYQSNDKAVADVTSDGLVSSTGKGDTHIVAFYDNGVTPVPVLRPLSEALAAHYPEVPTPTPIDTLVVSKLRKLGIVPSDMAGDAEFLRRVSLDMTGTLPRPEEVAAFLANTAPDKRAAKVDELLGRPEYAAWWATKFCDFTGNNSQNVGNNSFRNEESRQWYEWIYDRIARNVPYDELVAGIVVATGRAPDESFEDFCRAMGEYYKPNDPADFCQRPTMPHFWSRRDLRQPEQKALSFAHAFLGLRLECAQCHKHPFDQWSKHDFEQFTGLFAPVQYGTPRDDNKAYQEMNEALGLKGAKGKQVRASLPKLLREGKVVPWREVFVSFAAGGGNRRKKAQDQEDKVPGRAAALLGGEPIHFKPDDDPRTVLMDWMRSQDNPYFARALVNRVWASYFNVGLIDPPDDLNLANPPSNGPLLDWLSREFVAQGYDLKWLHRTIALSRTYQLSWMTNESNRLDTRNYSHAVPRRLPAEVLYDALRQATAADDQIDEQMQIDQRAIGPSSGYLTRGGGGGPSAYALRTFGKPARTTNCDCERSLDPSLLQTLYLQNDAEVLGLVERRGGWLRDVAARSNLTAKLNSAPDLGGRQGKGKRKFAAKEKGKLPPRLQKAIAELQEKFIAAKKAGDQEQIAKLKEQRKKLLAQRRKLEEAAAETPKPESKATAAASDEAPAQQDLAQALPPASDHEPQPPEPTVADELGPQWIRDAYLHTLSRPPSDQELARAQQHLRQASDPIDGLRDVLWALLNTKEFIVNH